jgi:hypothetical protein
MVKKGVRIQTQKKLNDDDKEKILIKFDLSLNFGPCRGITRTQRYDRAVRLKLNPQVEIKNLITNKDLNISVYDKQFL